MSQHADLTARGAEVIRILLILRSHSDKLVVIGGYAVSALAAHRFSVDCDVVIQEKELRLLEKILKEEGYAKTKSTQLQKGTHGAKTAKYVKQVGGRKVAVDLYVNSVLSRNTGGEWSYESISQNSMETNVVGITDSTIALVPKKELLIAMKLHASRDADLRDIVMLDEGTDWKTVADFTSTGSKRKIKAQLGSAIKRIGSKGFPPSLKAEFGLRIDVTLRIKATLEHLKTVKELLAGKRGE